jgi:hypothetical protein
MLFSIVVLFSHKNNEIMWFEGKWMKSEDITLGEVIQAQKDKGCMFSLICG